MYSISRGASLRGQEKAFQIMNIWLCVCVSVEGQGECKGGSVAVHALHRFTLCAVRSKSGPAIT